MKYVIDRGKRSKTLTKVKPVKNRSNNPQNFLEMSPVQKKVIPSHKLQTMPMSIRILEIKEDETSHRNCQNQLNHPSLSHIEPDCQDSSIHGKSHI